MTVEEELKRITSKILDEARAKGNEIINQGKRDAKSIEEEAFVRSKAAEDRIVRDAERHAEQEKKKIIADATIRARKRKLDAREEVIDKGFQRAQKTLQEAANSQKYSSILNGLIREACAEMGGGDIEVLARKEDAKTVEKILPGLEKVLKEGKINVQLSLSNETINELGVIVRSRNGKVEVSNTLNSRLERLKPTLRVEVAKILFK